MLPKVFLDHYRVTTAADGSPIEMARNGPAITYKASDLKSGAPVTVTVVPTVSVDPAEREQFEKKARTAMLLDHANIAKTVAFGSTDESLVFVSEYPLGETVEAWVKVHGPMPPDAVLRVALQVVSALGAASFHGLTHPAIQPANLVIVTGKTAEGGWPLIKLTHFALSGLKSAPGHAEPDVGASDYASPEQLLQGNDDFRSEIYSLGATMCFLLTGVFYSAYPRSPQTKRFRGPLRKLIARMLEDDPQFRPNDPVLFTEELRTCLAAVERRQRWQHQYGMPLAPLVKRPKAVRRFRRPRPVPLLAPVGMTTAPISEPAEPVARPRLLRPAWAIVACLLALGIAAALFLPEDIVTAAFRRNKSPETIGVPIGVPDPSSPTVVTSASPASSPIVQASVPVSPESKAVLASHPGKPIVRATSSPASNAIAAIPSASPLQDSVPDATTGTVPENTSSVAVVTPNPVPEQSPATIAYTETSAQPQVTAAPLTPQPAIASHPAEPTSHPAAAVVAANTVAQEPAPPAEPADEPARASAHENSPEDEANPSATAAAPDNGNESRLAATKPSPARVIHEQKPRTKKTVTSQNRSPSRQRAPRALPVEPNELPVERGTFHARVVGITPNGNVILALPNGERAIVAPQDADSYSRDGGTRRRPRRVIIERRIVTPEPASPYQPFLPPGD